MARKEEDRMGLINRPIKPATVIYKVFRLLLLIGICYLFLFPVLYLVSLAVRDPATVEDPSIIWLPKAFSLSSIKKAAELMKYGRSVILTLVITVFSTIGTLLSCSMVGYGLSRFKFKTRPILFAVVILMIVVPPQLLLIPQFLNYRYFTFGGLTTLLNLESINLTEGNTAVLTYIVPAFCASGLRAGIFIFIFRQFFSGMHKELEEAARVDGCNAFGIFFKIALPLSVPIIVTVILYSVIWHWNEYYTSTIYFLGDVKPISVMLRDLGAKLTTDDIGFVMQSKILLRTYLAAGALITIIPPLVLYIFTQRYFVESIENTGLVG